MRIIVIVFFIISINSTLFGKGKDTTGFISKVKIEVGYSTSIFIQNNSIDNIESNSLALVPNYFGVYYSLQKFRFALSYKSFSQSPNRDKWEQGDIYLRQYNAIDLGIGLITPMIGRNLEFSNFILLSARPSGTENIYLSSINGSVLNEPIFANYSYKSLGVGFKSEINYALHTHLVIGFSLDFNHYFEDKKLRSQIDPSNAEFEDNYKINRDMITPSFTIGYLF